MKKAFFSLHFAVLLAGFTGVLGRLISLDALNLVWYRLLLSSLAILGLSYLRGKSVRLSPQKWIQCMGIGIIAAMHWIAFYDCIKESSVSLALICFSSIGLFTAIIEPIVFRRKLDKVELVLGLFAMAGIAIIFGSNFSLHHAIWIGLLAAMLGSLFPTLSRIAVQSVPYELVTFFELVGGWVFISIIFLCQFLISGSRIQFPKDSDWVWLIILAILCTVLAMNLSMSALRRISAFTVNLTYNLEPVYGILLAFIVFREDKTVGRPFFLGIALILFSIVAQMVRLWSANHSSNSRKAI